MTTPFVNFKMQPTSSINSTPTLIFGNDQHTCIIDGLVLSNTSENVIKVTVSVAREVAQNKESYFSLASKVFIQPNDRIDILINAVLNLEPGDLLYASSDYSTNSFDTFVSYRELTEL